MREVEATVPFQKKMTRREEQSKGEQGGQEGRQRVEREEERVKGAGNSAYPHLTLLLLDSTLILTNLR